VFLRSHGRQRGRDGCRVPLPWRRGAPHAGFSTADPWLPVPPGWDKLAVDAQAGSGESTLGHFRRALEARRRLVGQLPETVEWLHAGRDVLAYRRGRLVVACNFASRPVRLQLTGRLLLASNPLARLSSRGLQLPPNSAAWLHR
jgi:alpha-glucosidase